MSNFLTIKYDETVVYITHPTDFINKENNRIFSVRNLGVICICMCIYFTTQFTAQIEANEAKRKRMLPAAPDSSTRGFIMLLFCLQIVLVCMEKLQSQLLLSESTQHQLSITKLWNGISNSLRTATSGAIAFRRVQNNSWQHENCCATVDGKQLVCLRSTSTRARELI